MVPLRCVRRSVCCCCVRDFHISAFKLHSLENSRSLIRIASGGVYIVVLKHGTEKKTVITQPGNTFIFSLSAIKPSCHNFSASLSKPSKSTFHHFVHGHAPVRQLQCVSWIRSKRLCKDCTSGS